MTNCHFFLRNSPKNYYTRLGPRQHLLNEKDIVYVILHVMKTMCTVYIRMLKFFITNCYYFLRNSPKNNCTRLGPKQHLLNKNDIVYVILHIIAMANSQEVNARLLEHLILFRVFFTLFVRLFCFNLLHIQLYFRSK